MKFVRNSILAILVLGISGCTITQEIRPVAKFSSDKICIIENPKVKAGFLKQFRATLVGNRYQVQALPANAGLNDCETTAIYIAHWSWDLALYMSYAKISVFGGGRPIGSALYDARQGGGNFDKFIDAEEKINELVNQLFPKR